MEKVSKIRIGFSDYEIYDKYAHERIDQLAVSGCDCDSKTKDKEYDPENNSGLGRKVLVLKDGSNVLFQSDFDKENTIYVIEYDFVLGEDVVVPTGCILDFDGGSISNTLENEFVLSGTYTKIRADKTAIFTNIKIGGTWNVLEITSAWFSDITSENMLRQLINLTSDNPEHVYIDEGDYLVSVEETDGVALEFSHNNTYIHNSGTIRLNANDHWGYYGILLSGDNIIFDGGEFIGDAKDHDYSTYQGTSRASHEWGRGIVVRGQDVIVQNTKSSLCTGDAFNIRCDNTILRNFTAEKSRRQGVTVSTGSNAIVENYKISYIGDFTEDGISVTGTAPMTGIDVEPNKTSYGAVNVSIRNGVVENVGGGAIHVLKSYTASSTDTEEDAVNKRCNLNCTIENLTCKHAKMGIAIVRSANAIINNVSIEDAQVGLHLWGVLNTELYQKRYSVIINNLNCRLRRGTMIQDGDNVTYDEDTLSTSIENYACNIIVNNSYLKGNRITQSGAGSSLTFNKCSIVNDQSIDKGTFFFNDCTISNEEQDTPQKINSTTFCGSRPLSVSNEGSNPIYMYFKNCTINLEKADNSFTILTSGGGVNLLFEDCVFNDKNTGMTVVARIRTNCRMQVVDCIKPDGFSFYSSHSDGDVFENYSKLYQSGPSTERPILTTSRSIGLRYFDDTLGKPIYWNGTYWVDSVGTRITWRLIYVLTDITASNRQLPDNGAPFTTVLTAAEGYSLPSSIRVRMNNVNLAEGTEYTYNASTGEVTILGTEGEGGVTEYINITATAIENRN